MGGIDDFLPERARGIAHIMYLAGKLQGLGILTDIFVAHVPDIVPVRQEDEVRTHALIREEHPVQQAAAGPLFSEENKVFGVQVMLLLGMPIPDKRHEPAVQEVPLFERGIFVVEEYRFLVPVTYR